MNKFIEKLSLQRFVTIIAFCLSLSTLLTAFAVFYLDSKLSYATAEISDALKAIDIGQSLEINLLAHKRNTLLYGLTKNPERKKLTEESRILIERDVENLALFHGDEPEDVQNLLLAKKRIRNYLFVQDLLIAKGIAPVKVYNNVAPDFDQAFKATDELVRSNMEEVEKFKQSIQSDRARARLLTELAIALMLTFSVATFWIVRNAVYKPILALGHAIRKFAEGKSGSRVAPHGLSDVRIITETFNNMAISLEEQRKIQLSFLSSIAHDLRNPLGTINMSLDLLKEQSALGQSEKDLLSIVRRQVGTLMRLVSDLLDTTRIQSGNLSLNLKPCDLRDLVSEIVCFQNSGLRIPRIQLHVADADINCICDDQRISQVLTNLVSNALKYSPESKPVIVDLYADGDDAIIEITDQGVGISREDLSGIFVPFKRSNSSKAFFPGVGLGLSSSEKIIRGHNGKIEVESTLGQGSTFIVRLPLAISDKGQKFISLSQSDDLESDQEKGQSR